MDEKYLLKWNDFQTNVVSSFGKLRNQSTFTDITLVSADKKQISAHKIVLAASSGFFSNIFEQNTQSHLMICLDGISSTELIRVLDYIYLGEVEIFQENLDRFLKVGEKLELEGLLTSDEFEPKTDEKPYDTKTLDDYEITETESFQTKQSRIVMNANGLSTIEE